MKIEQMSTGQLATLACTLEVTVPKPGNVHRGADFDDTTFADFLLSASVFGHVLDSAPTAPLGDLVHSSSVANQAMVGKNTNLGIILLICPLAMALRENPQELNGQRVGEILEAVSDAQASKIFEAIRIANPGGLGRVDGEMDVAHPSTTTPGEQGLLKSAMAIAADRDKVAYQYANRYETVFQEVVPLLEKWRIETGSFSSGVIATHIEVMSRYPDSLICRKCGPDVAEQSAGRAGKCLDLLACGDQEEYWREIRELDLWLRSDGNRRNPGTTADLIAAGLFVGLQNGTILPPF